MAVITIRGYAPAALLTDRRRGVIAAALTGLNFASEQDVRAARERITKMGRVQRFTDWAFHHGDKARALDALAILYLYHCAAAAHTAPAGLQAADRARARQTLAERLSPAGKQALLESFQVEGADEFKDYIAEQDRHEMVGDLCMSEARELQFAVVSRAREAAGWTVEQICMRTAQTDPRSANAYQRAAEAYTAANLPAQATAASLAAAADAVTAARAYERWEKALQAADAWARAAAAYTRAGQPAPATRAAQRAGGIYDRAGAIHLARRQYPQALENLLKAVDVYSQPAQPHPRAIAYWMVAETYMRMAQSLRADDRYLVAEGAFGRAKDAYLQAKAAYDRAALDYREAAAQPGLPQADQDTYRRTAEVITLEARVPFWLSERRFGPAARALGLVADMYKADHWWRQAAEAYLSAAELHLSVEENWRGAKAAGEAAMSYARDHKHAKAGEAWELCALAWFQSANAGEGGRDQSLEASANAKAAYVRAGEPHREVREYCTTDFHALARARARLPMEGAAPPQ